MLFGMKTRSRVVLDTLNTRAIMRNKDHCCVPKCNNNRSKVQSNITFHQFPKDKDLRRQWIIKIKRDVGRSFKITNSTRVCSDHFKPTDIKKTLTGKSVLVNGAVPSVFEWTTLSKKRKSPTKRECTTRTNTTEIDVVDNIQPISSTVEIGPIEDSSVDENVIDTSSHMEDSTVTTDTTIITPTVNLHDYLFTEPEKPVEELLEAAQARIEQLEQLLSKQSFYRQLKGMSDKRVRFHTGFSSFAIFVSTFNALRPTAESMFSWSQVQRAQAKSGKDISNMRDTLKTCKLSLFDQFYLCITKLRLGTFNEKLASEFDISISTVSRVFISWVNFLYFVLGTIPIWPSRAKIDKHMPKCFKLLYPKCRGIIDASEIKVQAPSSMVLNSNCYSSYKSHTTYKGNVVISPSGEIIHVSSLFEGSISDKELVKQSGLLNLLEPGDQIMADKGFTIEDLLKPIGCGVAMPAFLSSKGQFSKKELSTSKQIHNLRVHVERAIRRVKEFHYFDKVIPLTVAGSINQIWTVACLITNFQGPLLHEKQYI
nr:uncharacterized protein LOC131773704 [Pocillopora verrucosa]